MKSRYIVSKVKILIKGGMKLKTLKRSLTLVLSIAFLAIGILGLLGVGFFSSNNVLEIIQVALGAVGLLLAFGKL